MGIALLDRLHDGRNAACHLLSSDPEACDALREATGTA
jgi:hypothetical protein